MSERYDVSGIKGEGEFWRGHSRMPHMSQVLSRDLHGETISRHFGGEVHGYMLTDEQVEQRRTGTGPSMGMPYRYLLYSPSSYATSWTAFWGEKDFMAFLAAYAIAPKGIPVPGKPFLLQLPESTADWLPVSRSAGETESITEGTLE